MLTKTQLAEAIDLRSKCSQDVLHAALRTTNLCDDAAVATYVACGSVAGAGMVVASYLSADKKKEYSAKELSEQALFGLLFGWLISTRRHTNTDAIIRHARDSWESITGEKFNGDWLMSAARDLL